MRPFYSFILHHPIVIVTFRLLVHLLLNSFVFSPSRTRPMAISSFFLILIWAFPLVWLWPMKAYTIFLIQLIAFLVRVPIWSVCGWFLSFFANQSLSIFQFRGDCNLCFLPYQSLSSVLLLFVMVSLSWFRKAIRQSQTFLHCTCFSAICFCSMLAIYPFRKKI